MNNLKSYFFLVTSILFASVSQLLMKKSTLNELGLKFFSINIDSNFIAAIILLVLSFLFYMVSLKFLPLKVAYPSISIGYFIVAYLSHILFGTTFGFKDILGLFLIFFGVLLLSND